LATRTGVAILLAAAVGVFACWVGTLIAYDSTVWAGGNGWPVSFCIVAVIFVLYFASGVAARLRADRRRATTHDQPASAMPVEVG
jgi:zinc/manganese transport system permease protein